MKIKLLLTISLIVAISFSSVYCTNNVSNPNKTESNQATISAENPNIYYCGRFNFTDPENVLFDWSGTYIQAAFEGTSCSIVLNDDNNFYSVYIDKNEPIVLEPDTNDVHLVASELEDGLHTILIQKRTEAFIGVAEFQGFILDDGKGLVKHNFEKDRRIEFIGNSITCGYGVEGLSASENFKPATENAGLSYASVTAKMLDADYHLVSYSGKGMVRNYGDSNKSSINPMPALYTRTLWGQEESVWDFTSWIPQVVVINLGTNDFSTQPFPDKEVYQNAYHNLIAKVKNHYPGVSIFCISGPMIGDPCTSYVKEVAESYDSADKVYFIPVPKNLLTEDDWGSDWHPNISGQQKSAEVIFSVIKDSMNW